MAYKRKTAKQKMLHPSEPEFIRNLAPDSRWLKGKAGDTMVISTPVEIQSFIEQIPEGKVMVSEDLREAIAEKHKVAVTCPLTTGIFTNIVAQAAEEDRALGSPSVTPYWRVVKPKGELNEKFPGGIEGHASLLRSEGIAIEPRRKKLYVADLQGKKIEKFS